MLFMFKLMYDCTDVLWCSEAGDGWSNIAAVDTALCVPARDKAPVTAAVARQS